MFKFTVPEFELILGYHWHGRSLMHGPETAGKVLLPSTGHLVPWHALSKPYVHSIMVH